MKTRLPNAAQAAAQPLRLVFSRRQNRPTTPSPAPSLPMDMGRIAAPTKSLRMRTVCGELKPQMSKPIPATWAAPSVTRATLPSSGCNELALATCFAARRCAASAAEATSDLPRWEPGPRRARAPVEATEPWGPCPRRRGRG